MTGEPPRVSVVVVSRGRPDALLLCLTGLAQLDYPAFEIVVVADPAGIRTAGDWAAGRPLKRVTFDRPNISEARNLGIAEAAGEIVAFIDDDAVPEPLWLHHLCQPFADPRVAAAGGFVRGRNGISYQWRARSVDPRGEATALTLDGDAPTIPYPGDGRAAKTEGTNMAVRRAVLAGMGGFDPAFRFFLDETDLNLRLADAGHATALVPLAEVHHGYLASDRRSPARVPRDLSELGASKAAFLRKHCPEADRGTAKQGFVAEQRARLLRHMQDGSLGPEEVRRLMAGLQAGLAEGERRTLAPLEPLAPARSDFRVFPVLKPAQPLVLSGRALAGRRLRQQAARAAAQGRRVSLFLFSRSALFHRRSFRPEGYWLQTGGLYGRSDRTDDIVRHWDFAQRLRREIGLLAKQRGLADPGPQNENSC